VAADPDPYTTLDVPPTASYDQIARAYRRLARECHPDTHPGDAAAVERFQRITAAYDLLADPQRRAAYDRQRRGATGHVIPVVVRGQGRSAPPGRRAWDPPVGAGPLRVGPVRRIPVRTTTRQEITIDFASAVYGATVWVDVRDERLRRVGVPVPAGVRDGEQLRVRDESVDLLVTVRVTPHARFGRQGDDLTLTLPVSYPEAVLGATVSFPGLDGKPVLVDVPAGTAGGTVLRVGGRGIPFAAGAGDLLATVVVDVPSSVDQAAVTLLRELSRHLPDPRQDRL
jgi:molecular chaperone DnaJ